MTSSSSAAAAGKWSVFDLSVCSRSKKKECSWMAKTSEPAARDWCPRLVRPKPGPQIRRLLCPSELVFLPCSWVALYTCRNDRLRRVT